MTLLNIIVIGVAHNLEKVVFQVVCESGQMMSVAFSVIRFRSGKWSIQVWLT